MNFRVLGCPFSAILTVIVATLAHASDDRPASHSGNGSELAVSSPTRGDYILQPQDQIRVQVFQVEDINKQCEGLSLSQDCMVTLPLLGSISFQGKTVRQAEETIRQLYDKDYIVNPQVTLTVMKYSQRIVNVVGSVTTQGAVNFPEERGLSIVDAISLAGGHTRFADLKKVKLTRKNANGEAETREVNVDAMMKRAGAEVIMLEPGDIVYVPERMI